MRSEIVGVPRPVPVHTENGVTTWAGTAPYGGIAPSEWRKVADVQPRTTTMTDYYAAESAALAQLGLWGHEFEGEPDVCRHLAHAKGRSASALAEELCRKADALAQAPRRLRAEFYAAMAERQNACDVPLGCAGAETADIGGHYRWARSKDWKTLRTEIHRRYRSIFSSLAKGERLSIRGAESIGEPGVFRAERYEWPQHLHAKGHGGGSFARVKSRTTGQLYGVKMFSKRGACAKELKILQQCGPNSPHLPRVFEVGRADGADAMLVENVGRPVGQRKFSTTEAVEIIRGALHALAALHDKGYLHVDIHQNNVLTDAKGCGRLIDFGNAVKMNDDGVFKGVGPWGMTNMWAPERKSPPESCRIDCTSDLYEATSLLLRMMGTSKAQLRTNRAPAWIPDALLKVLRRALDPDPGKRYQSAQEYRQALKPFAAPTKKQGYADFFADVSLAIARTGVFPSKGAGSADRADHWRYAAARPRSKTADNLCEKLTTVYRELRSDNPDRWAHFYAAVSTEHGLESSARTAFAAARGSGAASTLRQLQKLVERRRRAR